ESVRHWNRLDELHRLDVEHRWLRMVAREAMPGVRAHGRAVATNTRNRADRRKRVQIEDGQTLLEGGHFRHRSRCRLRLRRAARDIPSPADRIREDVICAALASDPRSLEYFI